MILVGYAATVAACAPRLIPAGGWAQRSPRLAMTLWHASAASVLLAVGLAGAICLAPLIRVVDAFVEVGPSAAGGRTAIVATGFLLPVLLSTRLAAIATRLKRTHGAERRRHLELLGVLGHHDPALGATVVPFPAAAAYCVAGSRQVVVTNTAVELLDSNQLTAVIAHERAHLSGRHHLATTWATVLAHAFPCVPVFRRIRPATAELVELLADDKAVRHGQADGLAGAIAVLGDAIPGVGLSAAGGQALARVERLLDPPPRIHAAISFGAATAAVAVISLPLLLAAHP